MKTLIGFKQVVFAAVAAMGVTASAATYYVATTGNDETGDGTEEAPYRTIAAAIVAADAEIADGGSAAAGKGGIWIADSGSAVNCLCYANGGTAEREWGNAASGSFVNCATVSGAAIAGGEGNVANVTAADFENAGGGAYRPVKGGALHDAGVSVASCRAYGAISNRDASRKPRVTDAAPDIGCYERIVPALALSVK